MLDLFLLRHAKSDWNSYDGSDFSRDINSIGIEKTKIIGDYLKKKKIRIQEVLCSPSIRTKKTLEIILEFFEEDPIINFVDNLYNFPDLGIFQTVIKEAKKRSVMVISHEPGLSESIEDLTNNLGDKDCQRAMLKFPTSSIFHIKFNSKSWQEISKSNSTVVSFVTPRDLMD